MNFLETTKEDNSTSSDGQQVQSETSPNSRQTPAEKLQSFKAQYSQLGQQVSSALPRMEWMKQRDNLEARLRSAQAANEFAECARLGRLLQAHAEDAKPLTLSEADLLTLSPRHDKLTSELQAFCHTLVGSMNYECLEETAVVLEAVGKLDAQALAAAKDRAALAAAAAASAAIDPVGNTDESQNQILSLQRIIEDLKNDLSQRDAKIDALTAELSKLRASPIAWIEDCPADTYEAPRPKHRDSYIAEDFRWL
mmetsp:Transcript_11004/g.19409  ORF Transcript_11004/g.19409 Transcript_11004/m.19409 type:complete len:253 (+) Transcript_11004:87-845(+)